MRETCHVGINLNNQFFLEIMDTASVAQSLKTEICDGIGAHWCIRQEYLAHLESRH